MACKALTDLIPQSALGMNPLASITGKIPQIPMGNLTWREQQVLNGLLFLSNPSNMAAVKATIKSLSDLGDLGKLVLVTNMLKYAGMDGFLDPSQIPGLKDVSSALDCIVKNIDSIGEISQSVLGMVQQTLTLSNAFALMGLSNVLSKTGIMDSYAFSKMEGALTQKLGLGNLALVPGINGYIRMPPELTSLEQATYLTNSLAQTFAFLQESPVNQDAAKALSQAGNVNALASSQVAADGSSRISPDLPGVLLTTVTGSGDAMTSLLQPAADGIQVLQLSRNSAIPSPITPTPVPSYPVLLPNTSGGTSPASQQTVQALSQMGVQAVGNLSDAVTKQGIVAQAGLDWIAWKRRLLNLTLRKYQTQFSRVSRDLQELGQMSSNVPPTLDKTEAAPLHDILSYKSTSLLEQKRVLDYKIKLLRLELSQLDEENQGISTLQSNATAYSNAFSQFGASNTHPYTKNDPRTSAHVQNMEACGWVHLESIPVTDPTGKASAIQVHFQAGADMPVQPAFKSWFESVFKALAQKQFITQIQISSTTRPYAGYSSWHTKGAAADVTQINGMHIGDPSVSSLGLLLQQTASSLGAAQNFGPFMNHICGGSGSDPCHDHHIHLAMAYNPVCTKAVPNTGSGTSPD